MSSIEEFPASFDTTTKAISAIVCAIVVLMPIPIGIQQPALAPIVGGIGLFGLILAYAYSARGYRVAERSITVRRLIGDVRIPLEDVRAVRIADADDFRGCIRLAGSGGLFGYYGRFRTSKLGRCSWYLTSRRNRVVVVTGAKTAVFSPDEAERFVAAIRASAPVPADSVGWMQPTASGGSGRALAAWIGVPVGVLALGAVGAALLYSPGLPDYTLTEDSLAIHDLFYPVAVNKASVNLDRVRVVDFSVDTGWRPNLRTNGFANSHYQSGWFRVVNGQRVRMYSAGGMRLVLLPPKGEGTPVLLDVRNPEGFVEELQRQWGAGSAGEIQRQLGKRPAIADPLDSTVTAH